MVTTVSVDIAAESARLDTLVVGTILTYSGISADIFNLTPAMVSLEDVAQALSNICRYNGHIPSFYSVAEHSVRVANWLFMHNHDDDTVLNGLLHDAAEAYVGDMVRPLKRHSTFGVEHQRVENAVQQTIHAKLGGSYPHQQAVKDADMAIYKVEVDLIRPGKVKGWPPELAKRAFLDTYRGLTSEVHRSAYRAFARNRRSKPEEWTLLPYNV